MKKLGLLMALVAMVGFTACNSNSPDVDKKKMLIGKWELLSLIPEEFATYLFDERYMIETTYQGKETWLYSLEIQNGNPVLSFQGRLTDSGIIEEIGREPITILKLTSTEMEWEYYVGVYPEPVNIHEMLKKIE
jgi:hypothetical protein